MVNLPPDVELRLLALEKKAKILIEQADCVADCVGDCKVKAVDAEMQQEVIERMNVVARSLVVVLQWLQSIIAELIKRITK